MRWLLTDAQYQRRFFQFLCRDIPAEGWLPPGAEGAKAGRRERRRDRPRLSSLTRADAGVPSIQHLTRSFEMMHRALWVCGLCATLSIGCGNGGGGGGTGGVGVTTTPAAGNLLGTWTLTTTPPGASAVVSTVTLGENSLSITSPDFTFTATRTGSVLAFADNESPGSVPSADNSAVMDATQTAGTFNAGAVPFDLGGSWTMQAGPTGGPTSLTCTLTVSAGEIDGACQNVSPPGPWFSFTTKKTSPGTSIFGDFGGTWANAFTDPGPGGGVVPCTLDFTGNGITTCPVIAGNPLSGITFTYDGANAVSGAAQGWAEYSATR
jgi:hypothetical protein